MTELTIPGEVTLTSLILPHDLAFDDWQSLGNTLQAVARAHQWWLGDWLLYGERRYGDKYAQAIELTGLSYGAIATIVYTCKSVEFSRRRENLSFAHHTEVAPLTPEEQDHWLDLAEETGWTRDQLRNEVRQSRGFAPLTARDELERSNGRLREQVDSLQGQLEQRDRQLSEAGDEIAGLQAAVTHWRQLAGPARCPRCPWCPDCGRGLE